MAHMVPTKSAIWLLLLASLLTALNFYDRYVISIVVQDLKTTFWLSDTQIGLLSGMAFALVYSIASIPVARYADGGRHARVLGVAALIWSAMAGACGLVTGFWTLLIARFGVGLGESGGGPTTHALIARNFGPNWRGTAFGVIGLAGTTGAIVALSGGGTIAHMFGWRTVFYMGAVLGIPIALILLLTVKDVRPADGAPAQPKMRFGEAMQSLRSRRAYVWLCVGMAMAALGPYGLTAWMPAYLMRHFDLNSQQVGTTYGFTVGIATLVGTVLGGVMGDWLNRRDVRAPLWLFIASFGLAAPVQIGVFMAKDYNPALFLAVIHAVIAMIWVSPSYAFVQALAGPKLGATGSAVYNMCLNLVGQALGPFLVGFFSDALAPAHGADSLRLALIIVTCSFVPGVACFVLATRTAKEDIAAANAA